MGWSCEAGLLSVLGHYAVAEDTDKLSSQGGAVRWVCCQYLVIML